MITYIKITILYFLGFFPCFIFSQELDIRGVVTDIENQALPGVNVYIKGTNQGTLTDLDGKYSIKTFTGSVLVFSYMGMTNEEKEVKDQTNFNIILKEDPQSLDEVVVTLKENLVEVDKGKLTFNLKNSALTTGQTALDMLKKLPGLSVGQNDNILFRGASGINVMLDGKMTYLSGSQLTNLLKGMSAEDINKIELITSPTAEYDAAGNAGIINIIPKKKLKKGYAVDLRAAVSKGKYWMTNENISVSLRTKKINLYGSFDYNTPHNSRKSTSGNTINEQGNTLMINRKDENIYKIKYYTWRLGTEWQFLPKHNIGINYHGYLDDFKSFNYSTVNKVDDLEELQSYTLSENKIIEPYHYDAISMRYTFDIDSLGKKITTDANYTSYRNYSDGLLKTNNYDANHNKQSTEVLKSHQPGSVKIISTQVDADLPFKNYTIKTGVKYAQIENDNQFRFDSLQSGNYVEIEGLSNHFKYEERIAAAYISGSKKLNKTTVDAGVRVEKTRAEGYTENQGIVNKWQYTKLFPSLSVGQIINEDNKVDFSLSRRINRPSYNDLNPVRWYRDKYFYFSGNPNLVPELAWVYSLTYSLKNKYIFSAMYNQSINFISKRLSIDDNGATIKSQSDNFGSRHRYDFTISTPFKINSFWNILFFSDISYTAYPVSQLSGKKELSKWATTLMLQQEISLPKEYVINLSSHWFSSELLGVYSTKPTGYIDFGIKKSFLNKKLVAQLTISDIFNTNRYQAYSLSEISDYRYNTKPDSRRVGFTLLYHLGGDLVKEKSNKTEEQKRL
ncbi:outer membrane beta-barrel protein [Aquimarina muelleri]|uniref:TonB-dependent receptor n=1 Tax=Aquimarina muelleri TaxID=279356 RepID=A0A918K036_9FLAO|nr:outer membrane beta-barrel protein [Aquimarina muelleri]MCX2764786.1 TonB-dependent receptor [Aquimarina muelleri]GGX33987.1 TonB-dependent receptor [Aquimarina muelleri]